MALKTTGTLQVTSWDNRTVIDRSYGMLGLTPQQVTGEKVQIGLDLLGMVLADAVNVSHPLWCLDRQYITPILGQAAYALPIGTSDINRAFYRNLFVLAPTLIASGPNAWVYDFGANNPTSVAMWSITYNGPLVNVTFQSSPDNINWTTVASTNNFTLGSGPTQYYDIANQGAQRYWQVIPTVVAPPNVLSIASAALWNTPNDIEMYRMNKDDYWNMTNKSALGRPLQYWVNRGGQNAGLTAQDGLPGVQTEMRVWPSPDQITVNNVVMLVWRERYIMDVGSLQQQIEVPTRWFYTVLFMLADALAYCTPEAKPDRIQMVQAKLPEMKRNVWMEERDRSPFKMNYNLRPYTR